MKIGLASLLLIISFCIQAQNASLTGTIKQQNGQSIPFANVYIKAIQTGTSADFEGNFKFKDLPLGPIELNISAIGFAERSVETVIRSNAVNSIAVILDKSSTVIEEVVITGTMKEMSKSDSPVPVEVYSAKYFENNKNPSVFESLQNVNGVRPQLNCNVCNTGDIHINGLEGPYTMVLIDGMPIVSGLSTVYGLTGIPASLIDRIEIVKGPASTLYGSEAVGGLINVITKKVSNAPLFSADVYSTSWGEINTDLGAKYQLSKKVQGIVGLNYFNFDQTIDNNNDNFTDISLQDRISIFNKISIQRKNNRQFNIGSRFVYEDRWGGEMNWSDEYRAGDSIYGESIYTNRWELFGNYQLPINEQNINLQFSANSHQQNSVYGTDVYIADQRIGFAQLNWDKPLSETHDLLIGAAYRYTYYDDNTGATLKMDSSANAPSIIHLLGLFIQDQIKINEFNTLLVGARYDHNNVHGNIFSPRINYKWNAKNERTIVRLSAGNGFRVANVFTEDHAALTGAREVVFEDELKPEESINANLNLVKKFYSKNETMISLDFTAFYTAFSNRIIPDYESNPNQIIYANLDGQAVSQGVSLNVDLVFKSGMKIMGGITAMDVSLEEDGKKVSQLLTEQYSGVWNIEYTIKPLKIKANYSGNIYGPMRLPLLGPLDDRDEYSDWWSLQNIQLSRTINSKWEIYGGVKNLLNYTPPANSIARAFDPFDENVQFNAVGEVVPTNDNPNALTFDPSYVFAPNQGIRGFLGIKYLVR